MRLIWICVLRQLLAIWPIRLSHGSTYPREITEGGVRAGGRCVLLGDDEDRGLERRAARTLLPVFSDLAEELHTGAIRLIDLQLRDGRFLRRGVEFDG